MSLIDALNAAAEELSKVENKVVVAQNQIQQLKTQVLAKYCPFKGGERVPLARTRYLEVDGPSTRLDQTSQGVWHWSVGGRGYDIKAGESVLVGDNFRCSRMFWINDEQYQALPLELRQPDAVEKLLESSRKQAQTQESRPLTLSPHESAVLRQFSTEFMEGQHSVRRPIQLATGLTAQQYHQALTRLVRKEVLGMHRPGGPTDFESQARRRKHEQSMLIQMGPIFPGERAKEALALMSSTQGPVSADKRRRSSAP